MAPFLFFLIISISFTHSFNATAMNECHQPQTTTRNLATPAIFVFGDSYFDPGNNNYINTTTLDQANFWPYGETYFKFPTGRFSDGRLLSDFIAEYAKTPLIPAYMQPGIEERYQAGVNFASGGAGALIDTFQGSVISLKTQVMNYKKVEAWLRKKLKNVKTKEVLSRAIYLISIGTNDYSSPFIANSTLYPHSLFVQMVIGNLTTVINEIYENGGRKFGFINLGPLGCYPNLRRLNPGSNNGGCYKEPSTLAQLHNKALSDMLKRMEKHLPGFKYSLYDFYTNVKMRTNHPSLFGLKEGKRACCGTGKYRGIFSCGGKRPVKQFQLCPNPNHCLFWDSIHLTETSYKQMAHQMWHRSSIGPYSLSSLFHCH